MNTQELQEKIDKLQQTLDSMKDEPEFGIGKWWVCDRVPKWLMFRESEHIIYGFNLHGDWYANSNYRITTTVTREATHKEVEQALIKEAEKMGFKKGANFNALTYNGSLHHPPKRTLEKGLVYCEEENSLYEIGTGRFRCFINGKWAEIITEEPIIIKTREGDKEVEFVEDGEINVGCFKSARCNISGDSDAQDWLKALLKTKRRYRRSVFRVAVNNHALILPTKHFCIDLSQSILF